MPHPAPLRIGIDIRTADPGESGQQRYLWRLGGWLAEQGEDVHFLTVKRQPNEVAAPGSARLHRLHGLRRRDLLHRVRGLELDVLLLNPERSRPFRGIEANVLRPAYGTEHYRQKMRSFRTPMSALARRALRAAPWEALERRWERAFYEGPDPPPEIIAGSGYMKREILDSYDVPSERVHVVHNGIDPGEFSPALRAELREEQRAAWGIPPGAVCLLFMGHNYRLKGLWTLMEVVRRLREEKPEADLHLIVAGRGTGNVQRRSARRRVERLGLEGAVHLVGTVHPAIRAFAAADAFIHLSWHDSFGFVTLEAMASGLPVVTTPFVGAAEIIRDGVDGLIVDPRTPEDVVTGVRRLLDPDVRRRVGGTATDAAGARTELANFRQVHEIFRRAAARAGPVEAAARR